MNKRHINIIVFGVIAIFLLVKFLLATNLSGSSQEFLSTYKFFSSDGYDWIANGMRLFENSSITLRNPGLPLIVKVLDGLSLLYLLPLINQIALFAIIVSVYGSVRHITGKYWLGMASAILIFASYSIQIGANYILADYYAVAGISVSLYFLLKHKYLWSMLALGVSMLFQNFAYFLLPLWVVVILFQSRQRIRDSWRARRFVDLLQICFVLFLPLLIVAPWHIYKFVAYGSPFHTKVTQFGLISPSLTNVPFYVLNMLTFFGPIVIVAPLVYLLLHRVPRKRNLMKVLLLVTGFLLTAIFWMVLYDWEDRRFLLYLTPWLAVLCAMMVSPIAERRNLRSGLAIFILLFYFTSLPISSFFAGRELPLYHNYYLDLASVDRNIGKMQVKRHEEFSPILMNISPVLFKSLINSDRNRNDLNTSYSDYGEFVEAHYDLADNCIVMQEGFRPYILNSYLLINYNTNLDTLRYNCD